MPGLFYPPPQPTQPAPHAPIPTPGGEPPRGPTAALVCQYVVRGAWEPPPPLPAQRPLAVAPLTLTYGQQPPRTTGSLLGHLAEALAWPAPWYPAQRAAPAAPLTLTYGDPPPSWSAAPLLALALAWVPPDPPPAQRPLTVAPLTLTYGQQPPPGDAPDAWNENVIYAAWPAPWWPAQRAPLAIPQTYGQPPPPSSVVTASVVTASWPPVWYPAQSARPLAQPGPVVAAAFVPSARPPDLAAWQPPYPAPPRPVQVAPLTLAYGDPPPPGDYPDQRNENVVYASWPAPWWPAQRAPAAPIPAAALGPIAFRAVSSGDVAAPGATLDVTLPPGTAADDVLVLALAVRRAGSAAPGSFAAPAGWTSVAAQIVRADATPDSIGLQYFWALGSVANLTFTKSGLPDAAGWEIVAFTGVDNVTPVDAQGSAGSVAGAASLAATSVTVVTDGAWELVCFADFNLGTFSAAAFTDAQNASANASAAVLYNPTPKAPGATGTVSVAGGGGTAGQILVAKPFALRPGAGAAAGGPPPLSGVNLGLVLRSWQPPDPPPLQKGPVAPLTFRYGDQPPPGDYPDQLAENILCASWPPPWYPAQSRPPVAPLTLVYGQQPPPGDAPDAWNENVLYASWPAPWYPAQGPAPTAAWNVPPVNIPPPLSGVTLGLILRAWQPPDPPPVQKGPVAPLTLAYGDAPPRVTGNVADFLVEVGCWPAPWWPAQSEPDLTPVPPAVRVPYAPLPGQVLASWVPPYVAPPRPVSVVPLTLVYGQQPPRRSGVNRALVVQSWVPPEPVRMKPVFVTGLAPPAVFGPLDAQYGGVFLVGGVVGGAFVDGGEFGGGDAGGGQGGGEFGG